MSGFSSGLKYIFKLQVAVVCSIAVDAAYVTLSRFVNLTFVDTLVTKSLNTNRVLP